MGVDCRVTAIYNNTKSKGHYLTKDYLMDDYSSDTEMVCECGKPGRFFHEDFILCEKCEIEYLDNLNIGFDENE